jgi:hypothetical protein
VLGALEAAMRVSVPNIPYIREDDTVLIAADVSGSMMNPVSPKSKVNLVDVGLLLAILLEGRCKRVTLGLFATDWRIRQLPAGCGVLGAVRDIENGLRGGGTNGHLPFEWLNANAQYNYNKVFVFTDEQFWRTDGRALSLYPVSLGHETGVQKLWRQYRAGHPDAELVLWDLAGYGDTPLEVNRGQGVYLVAGWNDRALAVIEALSAGQNIRSIIDSVEL